MHGPRYYQCMSFVELQQCKQRLTRQRAAALTVYVSANV